MDVSNGGVPLKDIAAAGLEVGMAGGSVGGGDIAASSTCCSSYIEKFTSKTCLK